MPNWCGRRDALYREWTRNRADVEALRQVQAAIEDCLAGATSVH
jgi:hypothetical protein